MSVSSIIYSVIQGISHICIFNGILVTLTCFLLLLPKGDPDLSIARPIISDIFCSSASIICCCGS